MLRLLDTQLPASLLATLKLSIGGLILARGSQLHYFWSVLSETNYQALIDQLGLTQARFQWPSGHWTWPVTVLAELLTATPLQLPLMQNQPLGHVQLGIELDSETRATYAHNVLLRLTTQQSVLLADQALATPYGL